MSWVERVRSLNRRLFRVAAAMFVGLILIYAVNGILFGRLVKAGELVTQDNCDEQTNAAVRDLCQVCLCKEYSRWWCPSIETEGDDQ